MCVKNKSELVLRSTYAASHFNMLDIRLYACVNSTENKNMCATPEQQADYFNTAVIPITNTFRLFSILEL